MDKDVRASRPSRTSERKTDPRTEPGRPDPDSLARIAGKYEGPEWEQLREIVSENRRQLDSLESAGD